MGWLFTQGATKQDIVEHVTKTQADGRLTCQRRSLRGNTLWAIHTLAGASVRDDSETFIACYLLQSDRGYGWGYKDMTESMGPRRYDCPLSFLDQVPCPGGYATEWRERVRQHHAAASNRRKMFAAARVGDTAVLADGVTPNRMSLTQVGKRYLAVDPDSGMQYRIPKKWIVSIQSA